MPFTNLQRSTYRAYPFLDHEEFAEACHHLDSKYCRARLGPLRRQWRLGVHTALNVAYGTGPEYATFVQITRPLEDVAGLGGLEASLGSFSMAHTAEGDRREYDEADMDMDTEEDDPELLVKPPSPPDYGHVQYEIHLHPTYRAPCLWFSLHNLPAGEPGLDVDTVFRRLVPDQYKDSLRRMGVVGGISADHHPITGVPCFFVHPCLLGEAMAELDCSKEDYLMVWLGLVGGCVGLWAPKEMALCCQA